MLLALAPLTSGAADLERVQRTPSPRPIADSSFNAPIETLRTVTAEISRESAA